MVASMITECQCPHCQQEGASPERALHRRMNVFMSRLNEAQRRWYAALEAQRMRQDSERKLAWARISPSFPGFDRGYAACSSAHTSPQRS